MFFFDIDVKNMILIGRIFKHIKERIYEKK